MRTLYEINKDIEQCIMNGTDFETGEFTAFDELDQLQMEKDAKFEGVALFIKENRSVADAIKNEIDTLKKRMDKLNRNADGAEGWLAINLAGQKFSTPKVECSFRRSESVECDDDFCKYAYDTAQYDFITHTETDKPNKAKIKAFLKSGGTLEHCQLVEKQNISVR